MKRILRYRPSGSMVVAIVAVVLASAGSATGASLITGKNIKNNSITSRDVKNRSLLARDFRAGQIPGSPKGDPGPQGQPGRNGTNGFGLLTYPSGINYVSAGERADAVAECPPGTFPTGGNAFALSSTDGSVPPAEVEGAVVSQGFNFDDQVRPNGWSATAQNNTDRLILLVAEAACANGSNIVVPKKSTRARRPGR